MDKELEQYLWHVLKKRSRIIEYQTGASLFIPASDKFISSNHKALYKNRGHKTDYDR